MTTNHHPLPQATPLEVADAVIDHLVTTATLKPHTLAAYEQHIRNLGAFVERGRRRRDIASIERHDIELFLRAAPADGRALSSSMPKARFRAARKYFEVARELGFTRWNPTEGVEPPRLEAESHRPLQNDEVDLCRWYALGSHVKLRRPIAWALGECTATTSEIGSVTVADVDAGGGRVWLHGSATRDERWGYFTDWGRQQIERRLAPNPAREESLVPWRRPPKEPRPASSQAILETLKAAKVYADDVNPRSLPAWAGRRSYDDGEPIEAVSRMLGMRSLDQAIEFIGVDWQAGDVDLGQLPPR